MTFFISVKRYSYEFSFAWRISMNFCSISPQAAFNIPVGEIFNITDVENVTRTFRARLAEFSIKDGAISVEGSLKWNVSNDVVVMDSRDILPPKKELKVIVKVLFEQKATAPASRCAGRPASSCRCLLRR